MSDPAAPNAAPPAAPVAPVAQTAPAGVASPVQVHVHAAPAAAPQPPAAAPQQPAQATPEAPKAAATAAPVKPPYVNPYAAPKAPAAAAAPGQPSAPRPAVAAPAPPSPAQPAAPVVDPQVAALTARVDDMRAVLAITATNAINALPESLRGFVVAQYGDDPAAQIRGIESMRSHGLIPAAPQVVPQGATTLPAQAAPSAAPSPANPDAAVLAQYEALRTKSPQSAAFFLAANSTAITRARAARPS